MPRLVIPQASLQAPSAPAGPRVDPGSFGGTGRAIQAAGAFIIGEAEQRRTQRLSTELVQARATMQSQLDGVIAELERDPDYQTYGSRWDSQANAILQQMQASVDPQVWDVLQGDAIRMHGEGTRRVASLGNARLDDHTIATLTTTTQGLIARAGMPGVDHALNRDLIRESYIDAWQGGAIGEADAVRLTARDLNEYNYAVEYGAVNVDALGWMQAHGGIPGEPIADGNYGATLDRIAHLESGGVADIQNPLSSATGTFQFIDSTWRSLVERFGDEAGLTLAGRTDPAQSRRAAELHLTRDIIPAWQRAFGRPPTAAEVRLAWWFGAGGAVQIARADPGRSIAGIVGQPAMEQNPNLTRNGQPITVGDVIGIVEREMGSSVGEGAAGAGREMIAGLTPQQNETLYNRAERLAHAELERARIAIGERVQDETTALALGIPVTNPVTAAEVGAAFVTAPEAGAAVLEGLNYTRSLTATFEEMQDAPNSELRAIIAGQRDILEAGGVEGLADRAQRMAAVTGAAADILQARDPNQGGDPAAYVMSRDPVLAEMAEAARTPEDMAELIRATLAAQTFVDDPRDRRPLTVPLVDSTMASYNDAQSPADRMAYVSGLTRALGDDAMADLVLTQLEGAGLDPGVRFILDSGMNEVEAAGALALLEGYAATEQRYEELQPIAAERTATFLAAADVYETGRGDVWNDRNAIVGIDPATLEMAGAERETIRRLAIASALQEGVPDEGTAEDAAEAWMQRLFGHQVRAGDYPAVVPVAQAEAITAGMDAVKLALGRILPVEELAAMAGLPAESPRDQLEAAYALLRDNAMWINQGEGYAVVLPGTGFGGRTVGRTWTAEELVGIADVVATVPSLTEASLETIARFVRGER